MQVSSTPPFECLTGGSRSSLRHALSSATAPLARFSRGLLAAGLVEDIQDGRPATLLAPTNDAFESLPWSFDDLLFDDRLLEARIDLFEYLLIRARVDADCARERHATVHGEPVRIGNRLVYGRFGAARVLQTIDATPKSAPIVIHVLEQCVFPWDPKVWLAEHMRMRATESSEKQQRSDSFP